VYTDWLFKVDARVSKNVNVAYQRPYIGVLFKIGDKQYFAPLTSSRKGKKLKNSPVPENITFFPINDCKLGGVNLNNMIPVVKGVYWLADLKIKPTDKEWEKNKKILLQRTIRFLRKHDERLLIKAKFLYDKMCREKLSSKQSVIVCDFLKLELQASKWKGVKK